MIEFFRALNESELVGFDAELHFGDDGLPVENVDEDVSDGRVEFVPDVDDLDQFRLHCLDQHQFIVRGRRFSFLSRSTCSSGGRLF